MIAWCRNKDGNVERCKVELWPGDVVVAQELLQLKVTPKPKVDDL